VLTTVIEQEADGMLKHFPVLLALIIICPASALAGTPDAGRQAQLLYLLKHDCGSCHGMTRKGGLGPALLPENLHDFPVEFLVTTILDGRPGTPMPPWRGELSAADARWLVEALNRGEGL
jgi:cytochrome c55X